MMSQAVAVPVRRSRPVNFAPLVKVAKVVGWWFAINFIIPPFHHPVRQALRRAGVERHETLAKW